MTALSYGKNSFLNFEELSKVFQDKPGEFVQVLKRISEDFIENHMQIMDSIGENNLENFKKINHNLRGSMILFKIPGLPELMKKIEDNLELQQEAEKTDLIKEVHEKFNLIFESIENKINELPH